MINCFSEVTSKCFAGRYKAYDIWKGYNQVIFLDVLKNVELILTIGKLQVYDFSHSQNNAYIRGEDVYGANGYHHIEKLDDLFPLYDRNNKRIAPEVIT